MGPMNLFCFALQQVLVRYFHSHSLYHWLANQNLQTNVAMLTILNELSKVRDEQTGTFDFNALKIVYIAPMKALVQEMISNFSNRSSPFGIKVGELTWYD